MFIFQVPMDSWGPRQSAVAPIQPHLQDQHQPQHLTPHLQHMQYHHPFNTPITPVKREYNEFYVTCFVVG